MRAGNDTLINRIRNTIHQSLPNPEDLPFLYPAGKEGGSSRNTKPDSGRLSGLGRPGFSGVMDPPLLLHAYL